MSNNMYNDYNMHNCNNAVIMAKVHRTTSKCNNENNSVIMTIIADNIYLISENLGFEIRVL